MLLTAEPGPTQSLPRWFCSRPPLNQPLPTVRSFGRSWIGPHQLQHCRGRQIPLLQLCVTLGNLLELSGGHIIRHRCGEVVELGEQLIRLGVVGQELPSVPIEIALQFCGRSQLRTDRFVVR